MSVLLVVANDSFLLQWQHQRQVRGGHSEVSESNSTFLLDVLIVAQKTAARVKVKIPLKIKLHNCGISSFINHFPIESFIHCERDY